MKDGGQDLQINHSDEEVGEGSSRQREQQGKCVGQRESWCLKGPGGGGAWLEGGAGQRRRKEREEEGGEEERRRGGGGRGGRKEKEEWGQQDRM